MSGSVLKPKAVFIFHGVVASLLLSLVYFGIVSYLQSFNHAIEEFLSISYLMVPLVAGFGVQFALFSYVRYYMKSVRQGSMGVTASGGLSTGAMIACCAHHITDIAPVLGITAIASTLVAYQHLFIFIGLLSNVVGIFTILTMIQKHRIYDLNGAFAKFMHPNIGKIRNYVVAISLIVLVGFFWFSFTKQGGIAPSKIIITESILPLDITVTGTLSTSTEKAFNLPTKTLSQGGLTIKVSPYPLTSSKEVEFKIALDTHSGNLDFDLTKITLLEDDKAITYQPTGWSGSPSGGHHREGDLHFSPLSDRPNSIKLVIKGVYGFDWVFEWNLV